MIAQCPECECELSEDSEDILYCFNCGYSIAREDWLANYFSDEEE